MTSKILLPFLLLSLLAGLLVSTARQKSLVYDEVIYPAAGLLYWKTGDLRWNNEHPPLQKYISSLPLLTQNHNLLDDLDPTQTDPWRAGYQIFFQNKEPGPKLIFLSRIPSMALTLLLGFILFFFVNKLFGFTAGLVSLISFCFDPLVLANGSLALNDIFVAAFFFCAVMLFMQKKHPLLCGLMTGLAIGSKFSGFLIFPTLLFLWKGPKKDFIKTFITITASAALTLWALYGLNGNALLESFSSGLFRQKGITDGTSMGFLLGPISDRSTWFYYPVALLIKTPLPLLFLWIFSAWIIFKNKNKKARTFFIPFAVILLAAMMTKNHFGLRYLLPGSIFLCVGLGAAYTLLKSKKEKRVWWGLLGWLMVEVLIVHPHHMAYFNEMIGGSSQGYKWLDGSNQDWGQDLPALANFIKKEGNPSLLLSYVGSNSPEAWDIQYQDVFSPAVASSFRKDTINTIEVKKEFLGVSAHLLTHEPTKQLLAWLQTRKPIKILGYTLFVYDITNDREAALHLGEIYRLTNRENHLRRQHKRAKTIPS